MKRKDHGNSIHNHKDIVFFSMIIIIILVYTLTSFYHFFPILNITL